MQLQPGVPVIGHAANIARLRLSEGTVSPKDAGLDHTIYMEAARVPSPRWRTPSPAEMRALTDTSRRDGDRCFITVMRLELPVVAALCTLAGETERSTEQMSAALANICRDFASADFPIRLLGIGAKSCDMYTTTDDTPDRRRVGLHVDSWFSLPIRERWRSPNRLCLNLGRQARRLLFVNIGATAMAEELEHDGVPFEENINLVADHFLDRHPDLPVVSLEVLPGEAYVAPTEAVIHDGSTAGNSHKDVFLTLLGHFTVGPLCSEDPLTQS